MRRSLFVLPLVLLLSSACVSLTAPASPSTATPSDLGGTWSGDLNLQGTTARMNWTLTQNGTSVAGPVLVLLPTGIVLLNGSLSGTLSGSRLVYSIAVSPGGIPSQPACTGRLDGTVTETIGAVKALEGSYSAGASSCPTPFSGGTFTLNRR
jgi:hypothetical protein